jgi:hypothetical protein
VDRQNSLYEIAQKVAESVQNIQVRVRVRGWVRVMVIE